MVSHRTFNLAQSSPQRGKVAEDYLLFDLIFLAFPHSSPPFWVVVFCIPPPSPFALHLFSEGVRSKGLRGGRGEKKKCVGGVTNLRGSGSIQSDLSIALLLLFACHSLADFFTLVKAL